MRPILDGRKSGTAMQPDRNYAVVSSQRKEIVGTSWRHDRPWTTRHGIFHRPRAEAELISEQGFDPRAASFQSVNIANADMGSWMQQLVTQEGWLRSTVEIAPVPFSLDIPNQRPFEKHSILCFRHPSLPALERYFALSHTRTSRQGIRFST